MLLTIFPNLAISSSVQLYSNKLKCTTVAMPSLEEMAQAPQSIQLWFTSVCHQIAESRRVIEELSKEDPPTEPFKSKYAGRDMLKSALQRAQAFPPSTGQEMSRVRVAQATIFYYIGYYTCLFILLLCMLYLLAI